MTVNIQGIHTSENEILSEVISQMHTIISENFPFYSITQF